MTEGRAPAGGWRQAVVRYVVHPTPRSVLLRLHVPDRINQRPGQHYVVRRTAEDGYTAQRSYSVASDPADALIELFVERLADGEVSTYLADVVRAGDELEVRGPIGGWFVGDGGRPAVGLGGGTGVVPLVAMRTHADRVGHAGLLRLAVSSRTAAELPYADELTASGAVVALSRERAASGRPAGRLEGGDLAPLLTSRATYYVCGSQGFAEAASGLLVGQGVPATAIRVERFGPTG